MQESQANNKSSQNRYFVELIARAQDGDEDAFEELYNEYFTRLYRYVLIRVGSDDEADDITQLVFLKFYKNLTNWRDQGYDPSAYLYTIARSVIADYFRSKARKGKKVESSDAVLEIIADPSQNLQAGVISNEEKANLYTALQQLPENYQEALLLRYMENLSSKEIAQIIGKSDVATRKLLSRAVAALTEIMQLQSKENEV